jgi:hypothetical protein
VLIGAIGVGGDGEDQDDIVGASGTHGFLAPLSIRADQFSYPGTRYATQTPRAIPVRKSEFAAIFAWQALTCSQTAGDDIQKKNSIPFTRSFGLK